MIQGHMVQQLGQQSQKGNNGSKSRCPHTMDIDAINTRNNSCLNYGKPGKEKSQPRILGTFDDKNHEHVMDKLRLTIIQGTKPQVVSYTPQQNKTVGCRVRAKTRSILECSHDYYLASKFTVSV